MFLRKLTIGTNINIINENKTTFEGMVRTIISDNLIIQIKVSQPNFNPKKKGDNLEYMIGFEFEAYRCVSNIHEIKMNNQFATFVLSIPEIISRIERRKFLRLQTVMQIAYYLIPENEQYKDIDSLPQGYWGRIKNTFTMDIAGGGVSLIAYETSEPNQCVLVKLFLYEDIRILAKVVRSVLDENGTKYKVSLQFLDINPRHEKIIADYVNQNINNA